MTDVGGQVHERVTWHGELTKTTEILVIIYVVSLADYCRISKTKHAGQNKLLESLDVYKNIAQDKSLEDLPIVILFNKVIIIRLSVSSTLSTSCIMFSHRLQPLRLFQGLFS